MGEFLGLLGDFFSYNVGWADSNVIASISSPLSLFEEILTGVRGIPLAYLQGHDHRCWIERIIQDETQMLGHIQDEEKADEWIMLLQQNGHTWHFIDYLAAKRTKKNQRKKKKKYNKIKAEKKRSNLRIEDDF